MAMWLLHIHVALREGSRLQMGEIPWEALWIFLTAGDASPWVLHYIPHRFSLAARWLLPTYCTLLKQQNMTMLIHHLVRWYSNLNANWEIFPISHVWLPEKISTITVSLSPPSLGIQMYTGYPQIDGTVYLTIKFPWFTNFHLEILYSDKYIPCIEYPPTNPLNSRCKKSSQHRCPLGAQLGSSQLKRRARRLGRCDVNSCGILGWFIVLPHRNPINSCNPIVLLV